MAGTAPTGRKDACVSQTPESLESAKKQYSVGLTIRSAAEIVRYLGDLVYYEQLLGSDDRQKDDSYHNVPVTLSYEPGCQGLDFSADDCWTKEGGYLFTLNLAGSARRFTVNYRGEDYSVSQGDPRDHTLEVLAVVSHAINLNKSAADIRTTPVLQVVP